ncbi:MAG: CPXCG motif-containing cysteine-rich protein [Ignavibacteriaceae bacterium]
MFTTDEDIVWTCQYCGVHNSVWVDLTVATKMDFIEDCRICCRPNRIIVSIDNEDNISLEARPSDE